MSTTPNYSLYKPAVNETGWGTLVDGNFDTIDAALIAAANVPVTLSSNATLTTNQNLVHCTGTITVTLPVSPLTNKIYRIITKAASQTTVLPSSGTINGFSSIVQDAFYALDYVWDGTDWSIC